VVFEFLHQRWDLIPPPVQFLVILIVVGAAVGVVGWLVKRAVIVGSRRSKYIDSTLQAFLDSLLNIAIVLFVVIAVLLAAGIPAATLGGLLAGIGIVVGLAMQHTLGNLAAGVLLLVNRPYNVGDAVDIKGHGGVVVDLGVAMTRLRTFDGRYLSVPNGEVIKDAILNHSRNPTRRVTVEVDVAYEDDLDVALRTIMATLAAHPDVLPEPRPEVQVMALAADGVTLNARAWVPTARFGIAASDLRSLVKHDLEAAGLSIPFPQRDVHLHPAGPLRVEPQT
jgi:small conductance mechanosensitive channel